MNKDRIVEQLKKDEGFSPKPYWDNDQWTWGYGTKAPSKDMTITEPEAAEALSRRVDLAIADFQKHFTGVEMNDVRAEALVNMFFNLGETKFSKFKNLFTAIRAGAWGTAAYEAYNSLWFRQLSKPGLKTIERAERIVWELLTGRRE